MAYADSSDVLTDEEKAAQAAATTTGEPVTSGATSTAPSVDSGQTSVSATASGAPSFVNLADYVNANQSVSNVGADAITNKVNSDISAATTDLTNTVNTETANANTAANPSYTTDNIGDILSGSDSSALTGFTDWWNNAETPSSAPVVTAADSIAKDQAALTDTSTRQQQLNDVIGPSAASWLDQAVYGKAANTAQDAASSTLSNYVNSTVPTAQTAISDAYSKADQAKKDTKNKLKDYMGTLRGNVGSKIQSGITNQNADILAQDSYSPSSVHYGKQSANYQPQQLTSQLSGGGVEGAIGGGAIGYATGGMLPAVVGGYLGGKESTGYNAPSANGGSTVNFKNMGAKQPTVAVQDQYSFTPGTQASFDPTSGTYTGNVDQGNANTWNNISKFLGGPSLTKAGEASSGSWVKKQTPTGGNRVTTKRGATPGRGK
jgi:hypothetical protein